MGRWLFIFCAFLSWNVLGYAHENLSFIEKLSRAEPGDYLVTYCQKTYTVLCVKERRGHSLLLEEVILPEGKKSRHISWKQWIHQQAPGNTSWAIYDLNLTTGQMDRSYSFTKNRWFSLSQADNFLGTLMTLSFQKVPDHERKKTGIAHTAEVRNGRRLWQPKMLVEGSEVRGVTFDAWTTRWPKDGSQLSGKKIEVYLPREESQAPTYFPYWLQVSGVTGPSVVRVVDSGKNLASSKPSLPEISLSIP